VCCLIIVPLSRGKTPFAVQLNNNKIPWPESASELYRPSDHRLSEKLVPTSVDRGCHVVRVTDPYDLLFLSSSSSIVLTRLRGPRSRPQYLSENLVTPGVEPGHLDLEPETLTTRPRGSFAVQLNNTNNIIIMAWGTIGSRPCGRRKVGKPQTSIGGSTRIWPKMLQSFAEQKTEGELCSYVYRIIFRCTSLQKPVRERKWRKCLRLKLSFCQRLSVFLCHKGVRKASTPVSLYN
jgi:hypothetical protein